MWAVIAYGLASGLLYGAVINAYDVIGFLKPFTWAGAFTRVLAAVPFDAMHSLATALFLAVLYAPWMRRIERVVRKYDLRSDN